MATELRGPRIRPWQVAASFGLAAVGVAGLAFGTRLARQNRATAAAPKRLSSSEKSDASGYPGLSRGAMQALQTQLLSLGYDPGKLDGVYGPRTRAAVAAFQTATEGLEVDGKPGPATRNALGAIAEATVGPSSECDPLAFADPYSICTYDDAAGGWRVVPNFAAMEGAYQEVQAAAKAHDAEVERLTQAQQSELPKARASEDLGFSRDGKRYVGDFNFYMLRVLEPWLAGEVQARRLVTRSREDLAEEWEDRQGQFVDRTSWTWGRVLVTAGIAVGAAPLSIGAGVLGLGKAYVDYLAHEAAMDEMHLAAMENTARASAARFLEDARVRTPDGDIRIVELPDTDARNQLLRAIVGRIGYFQRSN